MSLFLCSDGSCKQSNYSVSSASIIKQPNEFQDDESIIINMHLNSKWWKHKYYHHQPLKYGQSENINSEVCGA